MKERLLEKYPYLQIAGMYSPPFRSLTKEEDEEIIQNINASNPDFTLIILLPSFSKILSRHMVPRTVIGLHLIALAGEPCG